MYLVNAEKFEKLNKAFDYCNDNDIDKDYIKIIVDNNTDGFGMNDACTEILRCNSCEKFKEHCIPEEYNHYKCIFNGCNKASQVACKNYKPNGITAHVGKHWINFNDYLEWLQQSSYIGQSVYFKSDDRYQINSCYNVTLVKDNTLYIFRAYDWIMRDFSTPSIIKEIKKKYRRKNPNCQ